MQGFTYKKYAPTFSSAILRDYTDTEHFTRMPSSRLHTNENIWVQSFPHMIEGFVESEPNHICNVKGRPNYGYTLLDSTRVACCDTHKYGYCNIDWLSAFSLLVSQMVTEAVSAASRALPQLEWRSRMSLNSVLSFFSVLSLVWTGTVCVVIPAGIVTLKSCCS